ncbi:MAG: SIS domain-containing protein [Bacteroidales bacterium]|nr:SIS domain-containing protein [Bacteroidales bacterium]
MTQDLHTYKEIKQQPRMWLKASEIILQRKDEIKAFVDKYISEGFEIVMTGAGTSAYIGDALEPALFDTRFRGARAIATTDILTAPEFYFDKESKVMLISFARSGNSPESIGAVKAVEATAGKVAHIFITCNAEGQLAMRKGDNVLCVLLPPETNDLSLAMTSSYSTMLLSCSMIANIDNLEEHKAYIESISKYVEAAMEKYESRIEQLTRRDFRRAIFLGSGPLQGVAEESRLKLQELTDGAVMCAFDSILGFRHGPKALVNPESLMVYLVSPKANIRRYELDLIHQIQANNTVKATVVVCLSDPGVPSDLCVELGYSEDVPACYGCVGYVFAAQMLGMLKSINSGLCPDSPSVSGNISRVVEGVTLYI